MDDDRDDHRLIKLRGAENWAVWRFQARMMLLGIEAWAIVQGENPKPTPPANAEDRTEVNTYVQKLKQCEKIEGKVRQFQTI